MEPDVGALATQQDAVDLSQAMILGQVTRDGRDMLMLRFPDGRIEYVPAELMPAAETGAPVSETAAETLLAGTEVLEQPLPGLPETAGPPMTDAALAARVAALEGTSPVQSTDPEQVADETFADRFLGGLEGLEYLDLARLIQATSPRPLKLADIGIRRGSSGTGARALQRLGIASLV